MEENNRERSEIGYRCPDMLADTIKGRKNAFKIIEGRHLKITYKPEDGILTVITAMAKGE